MTEMITMELEVICVNCGAVLKVNTYKGAIHVFPCQSQACAVEAPISYNNGYARGFADGFDEGEKWPLGAKD